ncbi:ATP-binding cassette domain-containing protein [Gemelliphila palaticanis]|uniref:ATP-binding cassette domain-containing protein n=1 Tax=Gemelliphila palaticanis TaxID=81950 RepID=A0ABX2T2I8_9BACL|nr:ATP-binding cassette domain-containing protein [Gemella palaticanis]MBF0715754.1 ATP-binding cassette domain-containing protein [Gemella palaticanis]NYS47684.1 ATP-binding cassette domain-containing protein [Gemella palaticanis]
MNSLTVNNLSLKIGQKELIKNISFKIDSGKILAIIGENGVGKTTFINYILNNINKKNDKIITENKNNIVGYVPQFRNFDVENPLSVYEFLSLPLKQKIFPWLSNKEKRNIDNLINELGISYLKNKRIGELSGGEKQKVYLAQALIREPNILLLDEFTASLDKKSELEFMNIIKDITKNRQIITLCITHEISLINEEYIDNILHFCENGCDYLSIDDFNKNKERVFKFCRHYVGEQNV